VRQVIWAESFRRAFKRRAKSQRQFQTKILDTLVVLATDPFAPALKTHKLQGELRGLWACSVEYDCRIIFRFQALEGEAEEAIMLIDIGTHDEVY
jgi:addiction module RelE/StbE family toxin